MWRPRSDLQARIPGLRDAPASRRTDDRHNLLSPYFIKGNARMAGKRSPPCTVENRNEQNMKIRIEQNANSSPCRTHELAQSFIPGLGCGTKSSQAGVPDKNRTDNPHQAVRCGLVLYGLCASWI